MNPEEILIENFQCESKSNCELYKVLLNTTFDFRTKQQGLDVIKTICLDDENDRDRQKRLQGYYQGYVDAIEKIFSMIGKNYTL